MCNATELLGHIEQPSAQLSRLHGIFERQTLQTSKLIDGLLDAARGNVELQLMLVSIVEDDGIGIDPELLPRHRARRACAPTLPSVPRG